MVLHHLLLVISEVSHLQADLAPRGLRFHLVLDPMDHLIVDLLAHMDPTLNSWDQDPQGLTTLVPQVLALVQGLTTVLLWVLTVPCMVLLLILWIGNSSKSSNQQIYTIVF